VLSRIDEEGDLDEELNQAMNFVALYELRMHEIGLGSILKAPIATEKIKQLNNSRIKTQGKVGRIRRGKF
jgi:hypothetical protein